MLQCVYVGECGERSAVYGGGRGFSDISVHVVDGGSVNVVENGDV